MEQRFIKKLGDPRTETIKIDLTPSEVVEQDRLGRDLREQQAKLAQERSAAMADFNQRKKDLELKEAACRQRASSKADHVDVIVQDWLTAANEVIAVRVDTNEPVARRTATGEELQEELFGGGDDDEPSGKPS